MRIGVYLGAQNAEIHLHLPPQTLHAEGKEPCDLALICDAEELPPTLRCKTALLWEQTRGDWSRHLQCRQIIGCGFSPRNSLTLSSLAPQQAVLSVQRAIVDLEGCCIPPQDIPLPREWAAWPAQEQLLRAGVGLLTGELDATKIDYK